MRTRNQQICGQLQSGHGLLPRDRREMIQEALEWIAGGEVVDQILDRQTSSSEDRSPSCCG